MEFNVIMAVAFDFRKRLGSGFFGEVWHAIDTGLMCEVALKCIPPEKIINQKNFYQEAQVLKAAEHPNIVRVNDTGTFDDGRIYVSMEYLPNGSLEDQASGAPIPLSQAKRYMIDILRGLQHAHSNNIVHRDIKPANILIGNNGEGKLSDFGLALPEIENVDISYIKKYQYFLHLAPEVTDLKDYTSLSDIYSCGITLYRLVNGDNVLPRPPVHEIQQLSKAGIFPPRNLYKAYVPQALKRLINRALNVNPNDRFATADDMRHAIEQQAFCIDWQESATANSTRWKGNDLAGYYCIVEKKRLAQGAWQVESHRGKNQASMRRVTKYCIYKANKSGADRFARNILQKYVNGKA